MAFLCTLAFIIASFLKAYKYFLRKQKGTETKGIEKVNKKNRIGLQKTGILLKNLRKGVYLHYAKKEKGRTI